MACIHITVHQQWIFISLGSPKLCHPFGGLPILYLAIPIACGNQHSRVSLGSHIVVWRIRFHIVIIILLIGIAPFIVFTLVRGMLSSSMVVTTSTKGTWAIIPLNNWGAILATAPISKPPALPPCANRASVLVYFDQQGIGRRQCSL